MTGLGTDSNMNRGAQIKMGVPLVLCVSPLHRVHDDERLTRPVFGTGS